MFVGVMPLGASGALELPTSDPGIEPIPGRLAARNPLRHDSHRETDRENSTQRKIRREAAIGLTIAPPHSAISAPRDALVRNRSRPHPMLCLERRSSRRQSKYAPGARQDTIANRESQPPRSFIHRRARQHCLSRSERGKIRQPNERNSSGEHPDSLASTARSDVGDANRSLCRAPAGATIDFRAIRDYFGTGWVKRHFRRVPDREAHHFSRRIKGHIEPMTAERRHPLHR